MIHAIPRPTHAVSAAPNRPSTPAARAAQGGAGPQAESLEAACEHAAGEQRADQAEQWRVLRMGSPWQQQRPEARAEERAEGEPDEREGTDDEPLEVAVEREQAGTPRSASRPRHRSR